MSSGGIDGGYALRRPLWMMGCVLLSGGGARCVESGRRRGLSIYVQPRGNLVVVVGRKLEGMFGRDVGQGCVVGSGVRVRRLSDGKPKRVAVWGIYIIGAEVWLQSCAMMQQSRCGAESRRADCVLNKSSLLFSRLWTRRANSKGEEQLWRTVQCTVVLA